ncbi:uncharacterized protein LODBEIA_P57580 [Lodderomyces beijingensis]|uniref:Ataxin-10 homolog n=1 Tax=Lodderomyces beijingensis TaxID=1775926 RepID=A0ABP0ZL83_9ASCO
MSSLDQLTEQVLQELRDSDDSHFNERLAELAQVVKLTSESETKELLHPSSVTTVLEYTPQNETYQLRLYRGLLLVVRNLSRVLDHQFYPRVITSLEKFSLPVSEWTEKIRLVYWEALANFPRNEYVNETNKLFGSARSSFERPVIHLLFRQFYTEDPDVTNQTLLTLLHIKDNHVMKNVYRLYQGIDFNKVDHDSKMLVHLIYDIVTHESFGQWIKTQDDAGVMDWLGATSDIVQTKDDWSGYQLVALLDWTVTTFQSFSQRLNSDTIQDDALESGVLNTLHIISDLAQYHHSIKFLRSDSNFLPSLIHVLKTIHENVQRVTMTSKIEQAVGYSNAKGMIITILSYLSYQSFTTQERVRELAGLGLVLSNCQIDNNNPFIKEQAILCVKYLLEKNEQNQKFVAELEATKAVDDEVLQQVGYKVDIVDGQVTINKKV